jgi:type II secretory ATPase GspE/PulE/Tfp pilus assembly ATPase PilB-like protein
VIREVAKKTAGMVPLREDGVEKVLKGITTLKEVDRVAY